MIRESKYENITAIKDGKTVSIESIKDAARKLHVTQNAIYMSIKKHCKVRGWIFNADIKSYDL